MVGQAFATVITRLSLQGTYLYFTDYAYRVRRIAITASTADPERIATGTDLYNTSTLR